MSDAATTNLQDRGDRPIEPLVFEKHTPGARAVDLPPLDVPAAAVPNELAGAAPDLPELGQLEVVRHYTHLAHRNFSVDGNFYPLGRAR
jgi:glycine dehydrogenase subunit 2